MTILSIHKVRKAKQCTAPSWRINQPNTPWNRVLLAQKYVSIRLQVAPTRIASRSMFGWFLNKVEIHNKTNKNFQNKKWNIVNVRIFQWAYPYAAKINGPFNGIWCRPTTTMRWKKAYKTKLTILCKIQYKTFPFIFHLVNSFLKINQTNKVNNFRLHFFKEKWISTISTVVEKNHFQELLKIFNMLSIHWNGSCNVGSGTLEFAPFDFDFEIFVYKLEFLKYRNFWDLYNKNKNFFGILFPGFSSSSDLFLRYSLSTLQDAYSLPCNHHFCK